MEKGNLPGRRLAWALLLALCLTGCVPVEDAVLPQEEPAVQTETAAEAALPEPEPEPEPEPIEYLSHAPYMQGEDGYFFPDRSLRRAELSQILANLFFEPEAEPEPLALPEEGAAPVEEAVQADGALPAEAEEPPLFSDVAADRWYVDSVILTAALLPGGEDGTFRPEEEVTLLELTDALCRGLALEPAEPEPAEEPAEAEPLPASVALAVAQGWVEADADPAGPVTRAEAAAILNRVLGRTPDRETLDSLTHLVFLDVDPAASYYYDVLECTLPHEYLEEDGETWNSESLSETGLRPGFHKGGGYANYVLEDGTVLKEPGLFTAGEETYLVSEHDGQVYADNALHTVDGKVVFATLDGALLKNDSWNGYQFDADGFYTTGDEALDAYVAQALEACTTGDMTRDEKLRACYEYVRAFKYLGRNAALPSSVKTMPMENAVAYANKIFETGKGDCYNFAAAFCFLARALGYEANTVVGSCGYLWSNAAVAHGWVEIVLDGETYLFDPQIENYNLRAGISNETHSAYQVTYGTAPGRYYKN